MFDCSINLALLDLHGSPSHPQDNDYSYYRHNLGVHLFPFESRVLENREKIRPLGEEDFMSSSASGLLFDLWVDNPVLLGLVTAVILCFLQVTSLALLIRKALRATSA